MCKAKLSIAVTATMLGLTGLLMGLAQAEPTSPPTPDAAEATTQSTLPETTPERTSRLRPRPKLSAAEYEKQAAELREIYSNPPSEWPKPDLDEGIEHRELGKLPPVTYPADNPYSKAKADLGKTLFFDARLSGSGQMACVSCHDSDLGWGDGRTVSFGHKVQSLKRNSPSIFNSAYGTSFFWDGRAASLEEQSMMPIAAQDEMHSSPEDAAQRIAEVPGYKPLFEAAFGTPEVTANRIAKALATFQRTIVGGSSKFDYFLNGRKNALTDSQIRGLHIFRTVGRCLNCHNGPEMTDHKFHNEGLTFYGRPGEDLGRYLATKDPQDVGKFKTPGLRNISRSAPYMHTGGFDIDEVVNFYNGGGMDPKPRAEHKNDPLFPKKSPILRPLNLNKQDLEDLKDFLESLAEPRFRFRPPEMPQ